MDSPPNSSALLVAGLPCTGKTLLASHAAERGAQVLRTRDHLDAHDELDWEKLIGELGGRPSLAVIDAIHSEAQLERARSAFDHVWLVCVHCDPAERELRWRARARRRDEREAFARRTMREKDHGLGALYCSARVVLDTSGLTHAQFRGRVDEVVTSWLVDRSSPKRPETRWRPDERLVAFPGYSA